MFNQIKKGNRKKKKVLLKPPNSEVTKISYEFSCAQHIGMREQQQDAYGYIEGINTKFPADFLAVICDGMGGMTDGAKMSHYAVERFMKKMQDLEKGIPETLEKSIAEISDEVLDYSMRKYGWAGCGTTLAAVVMDQGEMYWGALGDSQIFLLRDERIMRVNTPHNYLTELMERTAAGKLTRQEAYKDPDRTKLTGFIGGKDNPKADISYQPFKLKKGDRIILASDGLFNGLSDEEIIALSYSVPNQMAANRLAGEVISRQYEDQDNVTVCYLCYKGE